MKTIISHFSALEFWCSALSDTGSAREQCSAQELPSNAPFAHDIRNHPLVCDGILSLPVHVLSLNCRRSCTALTIHRAQPLPAGSLRKIVIPGQDEPLFVTSPELTLVHAMSLLSFSRAVHLGYEYCGTFAPDESRPYRLRNRKPLTTPGKIASYLRKAERMHGVKSVRSILPHILSNSASPRESTLAELLTLPYMRGGSKIEHPVMNAVIPIPRRNRWATDSASFRCDLFWRSQGIAVEYDSTLCHTGAARIAEDASRRNALEALGLTVVTATWQQVTNFREYNRFVRILAGHLGTSVRPTCSDYPAKQFALRRELIGESDPLPR